MMLETTIRLEQSGDLDTATQSTQIDGSAINEAPTFAQGILNSNLHWWIGGPKDPTAQQLVDLLFGQSPIQFTASRDLGTTTVCDEDRPTKIQQELLFAPVGGDMIVTITCQWDDGWWDRGNQYLLRMTEAYDGSSFAAELLEFENGANIYRDEHKNRYPLIFTKAP